MTSSSFLYDWGNISNVIRKIYELIHFNESWCDLYTMDYISQSLTHCSKVDLECVQQCTKFHQLQTNGLIFETNCSPIKHIFMKLGDGLPRKRGINKHTCPIFDNYFLASSNKIKMCTTDYIFQSNRMTYVTTTPCIYI